MKDKIPYVSIISYCVMLVYALVLAVIGFDLAVFELYVGIFLILPLIAEIVGIVLRLKKGWRLADSIAVLSADVVLIVFLGIVAISDLNSGGFLSGLLAVLIGMLVLPVLGVSLIVSIVLLVIRARKS